MNQINPPNKGTYVYDLDYISMKWRCLAYVILISIVGEGPMFKQITVDSVPLNTPVLSNEC